MNKPLYIFDLDGTLADISHRRHLVESAPKRWREFYAASAPGAWVWTIRPWPTCCRSLTCTSSSST